MIPWESARTGVETCPSWAPTGTREIHINGDVMMAVWRFWQTTSDVTNPWLGSVGYPLLQQIATFWVSKLLLDNPTACLPSYPCTSPAPDAYSSPLHLLDVIPPDEYADHVNDSAFTNAGAKIGLAAAAAAAALLGVPANVSAPWLNATTRIVVPFNATAPGLVGGLHPEYAGYYNDTVKQADVILLGFPLSIPFANNTAVVRRNDLVYYAAVTDDNGPAMTWGMFAAGYVALGDLATAAPLFNRSFANARPPFLVWTETPTGGAANFLT